MLTTQIDSFIIDLRDLIKAIKSEVKKEESVFIVIHHTKKYSFRASNDSACKEKQFCNPIKMR